MRVVYHARMSKKDIPLYVVLHNIRSAQNVGAIFRTADAVGIAELLLVGYTPTPIDRFGRPQGAVAKASLGAEHTVPWRHIDTIEECIRYLRRKEVSICAVERAKEAVPYTTVKKDQPTAFIFGNEIEGVLQAVIDSADVCIALPMYGSKESLNVSVTAGIVLYEFREG